MLVVRCLRTTGKLIAMLSVCGAAMAIGPTDPPMSSASSDRRMGSAPNAALMLFDLPRMALHDALQQYSSITGRSVLYDASQVAGRKSSPVVGRFTVDAALQALISSSGMQTRFASHDAFMLVPISARKASPAARPASPTAYPIFYGQLQARVTRSLCTDATLESGNYRLALRFRVNAAQAIEQLQVHATGRPELEPRIHARLDGLPVGALPPRGLSQPILLLIQPQSATGRKECAP